ncbi:MAG TPA: hypothetical protein VFL03_11070 [Candidatus Limnocylindrales bacterium]|nr:hypothetical protein [Candidatus Limnocylindrales bacterium]
MRQAKTANRVRLNEAAYAYARRLIAEGRVVIDDRDDWSEHQPTARDENDFVQDHGWTAYARWYLAVNDDAATQAKERYGFPYGDFEKVHRCGVLAAESRAAQYEHADIETAAAHLHGMLDALRASR